MNLTLANKTAKEFEVHFAGLVEDSMGSEVTVTSLGKKMLMLDLY